MINLQDVLQNREARIVLLETSAAERENNFQELLQAERGKNAVSAEMLTHQKQLTESYKDENGALRKQVKREKRKTKAVGAIGIVVIVLALL